MSHTLMPPAARRAVGRFVAIALAAVATGLAWVTGRLAHIRYIVATPFGTGEITLLLTVAGAAAPGLVEWFALAILERDTARPRRIWIALAIVVIGVSIFPVFATPARLVTQRMLTGRHCVPAAVLISGLLRTSDDPRPAPRNQP
ncbi:MAG: hypothetical protein QOD59_5366 [Mycobacterium sp.]|jgi:TRAP-type C4-dicarboxylate transport system permease small subunit|nr:hypothetical protein [Mycobacterium sp.]